MLSRCLGIVQILRAIVQFLQFSRAMESFSHFGLHFELGGYTDIYDVLAIVMAQFTTLCQTLQSYMSVDGQCLDYAKPQKPTRA